MLPVVRGLYLSVLAMAAASSSLTHGCVRLMWLWGAGLPTLAPDPTAGGASVTSIAFKELLPIVVAAGLWCHRWWEQYILCHLDNLAAVSQVNNLHA